jgi:putative ABC transport system permease protein
MSNFLTDVRFALRSMAKRPGTSALLVATLAVGLAANGVIFNFLDAMVLRPFPFPNAPQLVRVWETGRGNDAVIRNNLAPANLRDVEAQAGSALSQVAAIQWWDATLSGSVAAERVHGSKVSPAFFQMLGVGVAHGRAFSADEGRAGGERSAVVGHALWQRVFGGRPLVGTRIVLDGEPYEVVGIAPPEFQFPDGSELWAPIVLPPAGEASRDAHYLSLMGRLQDGRTVADAQASLDVVAARLATEHPQTNKGLGFQTRSFNYGFGDPVLPSILAIWQAGAMLVLLIACVNAANLVVARGAERQRELALRLALGSGRGRIVRQLLTEGVVAALAAVALSLPLTALGAYVVRVNMPGELLRFVAGWERIGLDWRTAGFSAGLAIVASALFSAWPALRAARADPNDALRDGGRAVTAGGRRQRGRDVLVVVQFAAAMALVATAVLSLRGALTLVDGPQGYDPAGAIAFDLELPEKAYADPARIRAFVRDTTERLRATPGVLDVGVVNVLPARWTSRTRGIEVEGRPLQTEAEPPQADARWIEPGYFGVMRVPLLRGRAIEERDDGQAPRAAVVSRSMAEGFWPGEDPLGRRFRAVTKEGDAPWLTVVGVSGDVVHQWLGRRNFPTYYQAMRQETRRELAFVVRTAGSGDTSSLAPAVRAALRAVDPDVPAERVMDMRTAIRISTVGPRYIAGIMSAFGALALVLAVSGVYGVLSYRVHLRTLEIGVRVALGATRRDVLGMTLGQAARLAAVGIALGGTLAVMGGRALGSVLRGAVGVEPLLLAGVALALAAAAVAAAWVPARRALAVDPARALRAD